MNEEDYFIFSEEIDSIHFFCLHHKIKVVEIFNYVLGSYIRIKTDAIDLHLLFYIFPEIEDIKKVIPVYEGN